MPHLSVREAAKLAGKDRSTILRAIDHGRLSATRDEHNRFRIDPAELERRKEGWAPPAPRYPTGVLGKYARLVGSAAQGAVCG